MQSRAGWCGRLNLQLRFYQESLPSYSACFGMVFFGTTLKLGYSVLTGSFTLTLMVLPLITRSTQEALKTVPDSYRFRSARHRRHQMVYDKDDPSSQRCAWNSYGNHPVDWTYRGVSPQRFYLRREADSSCQRVCSASCLNPAAH